VKLGGTFINVDPSRKNVDSKHCAESYTKSVCACGRNNNAAAMKPLGKYSV
jgi:hypothetical protein